MIARTLGGRYGPTTPGGAAAGGDRRYLLWALALAIAYGALLLLSMQVEHAATAVSVIWPGNALLVTFLLGASRRRELMTLVLVPVFGWGFAGSLWVGHSASLATVLSSTNVIETVLMVMVVQPNHRHTVDLKKWDDLLRFAGAAVSICTTVAWIPALVLHLATDASLVQVWAHWAMADLLGMLIVVPLLFNLRGLGSLPWPSGRTLLRHAMALSLVAAVTAAVFAQQSYPISFLILPTLVLTAFIVGSDGASLAVAIVGLGSTWATLQGYGPLQLVPDASPALLITLLQILIAASALVGLPVATLVEERRRAAADLALAITERDDALASMPDGIVMTDAEGKQRLCNARYAELFPRTAELRRPGFLIVDTLRESILRGELRGVGDVSTATDIEAEIRRWLDDIEAGRSRLLELCDSRSVELVPRPNSIGGHVLILRDVTQSVRDAKLIAARTELLEAMNRELDQFASIAAHDLRAPLRQIGILCDRLKAELPTDASAKAEERLIMIRHRINRVMSLVEGLRSYAHAGARQMPASDVPLGPILRDAAMLAGAEPAMRIEVPESDLMVHAPEAAIALICRNLLSNAVKHHDRPEGRIRVRLVAQPEEVEIIVEDDGPGIAPDRHAQVFDLFAQFRGDGAPPGGLGLSLVRRAATTHGGRVRLEPSSFGRGTAVHVTLPRVQETF